ncbi:MAG: LacI family transcriptional regulator [Actinobacteria bacterium]|nr:LacI family transcriptional regulator [Actinomycetota bacterium]
MKMVTIKEVAKISGLSVGTVSNVINGLETVSETNKKKVQEVIDRLGFKPSRIASSLSSKKTGNMGIIVPDVSSPFYSEMIKGISETLEINGLNIFLSGSNDNLDKETSLIKNMMYSWVDGLIIVPVYERENEPGILNELKIPVVLVNREIRGVKRDLVVFNNFKGAYNATAYLIKNNHKKIIILSGPKHSRSFEDRVIGFKEAMEEKGLYDGSLVFSCKYSEKSGYGAMHKALGKLQNIDAVFASSDLIALGAIAAIRERGLEIPGDISIVGFGDIYLSKYLNPPLTTIKRPFYNTGKTAVSLLLERISQQRKFSDFKSEPARIIMQDLLEVRKSVKVKSV